jgi:hypothetical protein
LGVASRSHCAPKKQRWAAPKKGLLFASLSIFVVFFYPLFLGAQSGKKVSEFLFREKKYFSFFIERQRGKTPTAEGEVRVRYSV